MKIAAKCITIIALLSTLALSYTSLDVHFYNAYGLETLPGIADFPSQ